MRGVHDGLGLVISLEFDVCYREPSSRETSIPYLEQPIRRRVHEFNVCRQRGPPCWQMKRGALTTKPVGLFLSFLNVQNDNFDVSCEMRRGFD